MLRSRSSRLAASALGAAALTGVLLGAQPAAAGPALDVGRTASATVFAVLHEKPGAKPLSARLVQEFGNGLWCRFAETLPLSRNESS